MNFAIIVSRQDTAGLNIASFLKPKLPSNMKIHFIEGNQCYADSVNEIEADAFIFASLHRSESAKPTLTAHAIGNWGKAEYGGKSNTLVPTLPFLLKNFIQLLQQKRDSTELQYEVSLESTHHGPYLTKPTVFIEIGSSPERWQDKKAAQAVAETILKGAAQQGNYTNCIGLGGQHYSQEFTKLLLRTDYAAGHICPKYALENLDATLLQQAISFSKAEKIVLDWKGLGQEKQRVMALTQKTGLPIERARSLLK